MQNTIAKITDQLISKKLREILAVMISDQQHGFLQDRSMVTNLMEKTSYIIESFKRGKPVHKIYFDLAKVFDRMSHKLLFKKLAKLAIPFDLLELIHSFKTNREYKLTFND